MGGILLRCAFKAVEPIRECRAQLGQQIGLRFGAPNAAPIDGDELGNSRSHKFSLKLRTHGSDARVLADRGDCIEAVKRIRLYGDRYKCWCPISRQTDPPFPQLPGLLLEQVSAHLAKRHSIVGEMDNWLDARG